MTDSARLQNRADQPSPGADEQLADERALLRRYARGPLAGGPRGAGRALHAARAPAGRRATPAAPSPTTTWSRSPASAWSRRSTASTPSAAPPSRPSPSPRSSASSSATSATAAGRCTCPATSRSGSSRSSGRWPSCPSRLGRAPTIAGHRRAARGHRGGGAGGDARLAGTPRGLARRLLDRSPTARSRRRWASASARPTSASTPSSTASRSSRAGGDLRARPQGPAPALRRGHDPERDRRAGRRLADARLADPARDARPAPRRRRRERRHRGAKRGLRLSV